MIIFLMNMSYVFLIYYWTRAVSIGIHRIIMSVWTALGRSCAASVYNKLIVHACSTRTIFKRIYDLSIDLQHAPFTKQCLSISSDLYSYILNQRLSPLSDIENIIVCQTN